MTGSKEEFYREMLYLGGRKGGKTGIFDELTKAASAGALSMKSVRDALGFIDPRSPALRELDQRLEEFAARGRAVLHA